MLAGLRVLVVDGDREAVESYRRFLTGNAADVRTATLGDEAAALVGPEWLPHVLLTDLRLPDMGGEQVARVVGRRGGYQVGLIAMTSDPSPRVARAACDQGFGRCLVKPIDLYDLAGAVFVTARTVGMPTR